MQKYSALAISLLTLLVGCAGVPQCAPQQYQPPVLGPVPSESFLTRIERLCCDSGPKQTGSGPTTGPAASSPTR